MFKYLFLLITFSLSVLFSAAASLEPFKMGKVTNEEMEMKKYVHDSTAGAVILGDYGHVEMEYNNNKDRFEYTYTRKIRVKIFNSNQFDLANQSQLLYFNGSDAETLAKLKGSTYNLENGKIIETELGKNSIFKEKYDEDHSLVKFTMPNVKENSLFEFEIVIKSPFIYNIPSWNFQHEVPTVKSIFITEIPEYLYYRTNSKGYLYIGYPDVTEEQRSIYFSNRDSPTPGLYGNTRTTKTEGTVEYNSIKSTWQMLNVPALTEEPYVACINNYISKIEFELASIQYPGSTEKTFSSNWSSIIKNLNEHEKLGVQLNKSTGFMNDIYKEIEGKSNTLEDKLLLAYKYIQSRMSWNGNYGYISENGIKNAYQNGKANVADINLLLIRLLKDLNIEAYPLILSTRANGFVPNFPSVNGFNYLIVMAKINGKNVLMDASQPSLSVNVLPKRCLNDKALVINNTNQVEWIELKPVISHNSTRSIDVKILDDKNMSGKLSYLKKGYPAIDVRNNTNSENEKTAYFTEIEKNNPGLKLNKKEIFNLDSIHLPIKEVYDIILENKISENNDLLFFSPMLIDAISENPFRIKDRKYPVDFLYPIEETNIINIVIPQNYQVDEKPSSVNMTMPSNDVKFMYNINILNNNTIQLTTKLSIKKTLFSQEEYPELKEFFTQMIKKTNEQIVLKKI